MGKLDTVQKVWNAIRSDFEDSQENLTRNLVLFAIRLGLSAIEGSLLRVLNDATKKKVASNEAKRGYLLPIRYSKKNELLYLPEKCHPLLWMDTPQQVIDSLHELAEIGVFKKSGKTGIGRRYEFYKPELFEHGVADCAEVFPPVTWEEGIKHMQANYKEKGAFEHRALSYAMMYTLWNQEGFHLNGIEKGEDRGNNTRLARFPLCILLDGEYSEDELRYVHIEPEYPAAFEDHMGWKNGTQFRKNVIMFWVERGFLRVVSRDEEKGVKHNPSYQCVVVPSDELLEQVQELWQVEEAKQFEETQVTAKGDVILSQTVLNFLQKILELRIPNANYSFPLICLDDNGSISLGDVEELDSQDLQIVISALQEYANAVDGLPELLRELQAGLRAMAEDTQLKVDELQEEEKAGEKISAIIATVSPKLSKKETKALIAELERTLEE